MRLVFATSTPTNVRGGSGTYVGISVLARAIRRRGVEVRLVAPDFARSPFGHTAKRLRFNLTLGSRVAIHRPDAVVGFDLDGFLLSRPTPYPLSIAVKGVLAEELTFERGLVRRLLWLQACAERLNVRGDVPVIATSRYAAEQLGRHYHVPVQRRRVVPELIDLARWESALAAVPAVPERAVILTVCHLYPRKRIPLLVQAMVQVVAQQPEAQLRLVGVGPEHERVQGLIEQLGLARHVSLLGHVPFTRLAAEYRRATLFCLPSVQEGFGIVLLEAMAAGLPIVASRAAAVPEVAPDGYCSLLASPDDVDELAAALLRLLDDPGLQRRLGAAGRQRVRDYDADVVAGAFVQALG